MEKKFIALVFIALLAGLGGGYGLGFAIYQPQISTFQSNLSDLQSEVSTLTTDYDNLNTTLQFDIETLKAEIEDLKTPLKPDFTIWIYEQGIDYTKFGVKNTGNTDAHDVVFTAETTLLAGILAGTVRPIIERGEAYWFNVPLSIDTIISVWVTCKEGVLAVLYLK